MIDNTLIAFRLPTSLRETLKNFCKDNDINQSQVIRRGIMSYISEHNEKPTPKRASGWGQHR